METYSAFTCHFTGNDHQVVENVHIAATVTAGDSLGNDIFYKIIFLFFQWHYICFSAYQEFA